MSANNGYSHCFGRLPQPFIKCGQGQAASQGHFKIRRIVDGQFKLLRQFKYQRLIVPVINSNNPERCNRIASGKLRKQGKVAIPGEQHFHAMRNADSSDPGIMHYRSAYSRTLNESIQYTQEIVSLTDQLI